MTAWCATSPASSTPPSSPRPWSTGLNPTGLLSYTGTQELTAVGSPTLDDLHDAEGLALAANVYSVRLVWLMPSRDFVNIRKLKDSSQRYQVQPDPTEAGAYRLLGHRVSVTNRIPDDGGAGTNESSIVLATSHSLRSPATSPRR